MMVVENYNKIMSNRLLITGLSLFIVVATIIIYERKRRGKLEIDEVIKSKPMSELSIYGIRLILSLSSIFLLVTIFTLILKYNNCDFPFAKYTLGTYITAVFLGSVGLFSSSISGSTIFGYMCSVGYLILNMMTKNKCLGNFHIFSMKYGSFYEKYWLLVGSIVLIFMAFIVRR